MGPAHNDFGYNEHLAITGWFLFIKIIDSNGKEFGYKNHPFITGNFFCIFLLVGSGTQCTQ